ncbi:hypothetical protein GF323_04810 [Candidatus Woesearchaeota archaeon]|nr:hypothetical protein [Candidatus Woesearchaeota archaeon]
MKCLAFVDLHGNRKYFNILKKKIKEHKPDFLICAGDFTTFEQGVKKLVAKLSRLNKRIFLIHGNHEEEALVREISKKYPNVKFIHKRISAFKNIRLIGWGGGGFTEKDIEFEEWARTIKAKLDKFKKKKKILILVSHSPFYNTALDKIMGRHLGNKSLTGFIKKFRINYAFCGHFHENFGKGDKIKGCKVFNPGPRGKVVTIE